MEKISLRIVMSKNGYLTFGIMDTNDKIVDVVTFETNKKDSAFNMTIIDNKNNKKIKKISKDEIIKFLKKRKDCNYIINYFINLDESKETDFIEKFSIIHEKDHFSFAYFTKNYNVYSLFLYVELLKNGNYYVKTAYDFEDIKNVPEKNKNEYEITSDKLKQFLNKDDLYYIKNYMDKHIFNNKNISRSIKNTKRNTKKKKN